MDSFKTASELRHGDETRTFFSLPRLAEQLDINFSRLPVSIRILLENQLRHEDGRLVTRAHIESLARWSPASREKTDVPFLPARVLMQDFTGVPSVVDLAAMRDAMAGLGCDPKRINPQIPVHLVIDHSVQVDRFGTIGAFGVNSEMEFDRNRERYTFLKWGQKNFDNFNVVPPATGICHQVNLEYLAGVVMQEKTDGRRMIYPDTLLGLDSHTTMINGIGVLGWGVGGIEAEAVMLGQPYYLLTPEVIGFELTGRLSGRATATDLVLTVTRMMRERGVVGKFIEFFGEGLHDLTVPDRATIANMTPEFGATTTYFPVDRETLNYLVFTGRSETDAGWIETYLRAQGLFFTKETPHPDFHDTMRLDLGTVEPSLAGPRRPHEQVPLKRMKAVFAEDFRNLFDTVKREDNVNAEWEEEGGSPVDPKAFEARFIHRKPFGRTGIPVNRPYSSFVLDHGSVVIAAITSCTNTSNPSVLVGAGLMAKKAVERGLQVRPWVKTSLAPGSKVVTRYLEAAGFMPYLQALQFHLVAYGCTTCIGNSGPLYPDVARVVQDAGLTVASVLSGNRNYEGRINPLTRANYLASPMLVVAYALAGTVNIDMETEPLSQDPNGEPVYLADIWPDREEIDQSLTVIDREMFRREYGNVYEGDAIWKGVSVSESERYPWDENSTYTKAPPFFAGMSADIPALEDIRSARVLALLGDTITTDHISPAGTIPEDSPAGRYLLERGVKKADFNSYGSRRGNHEVMLRGTFANVRLRNRLVPEREGGWTRHLPDGDILPIYDAAMKYGKEKVPLIVIAGKAYGSGSSRDWAAKGTLLLGVRAVITESYERIHRSNLLSMGVLPLQFRDGENAGSLGLTGEETFDIAGIREGLAPGRELTVRVTKDGHKTASFPVITRLDSPIEVEYYRHGGILKYVIRQMIKG